MGEPNVNYNSKSKRERSRIAIYRQRICDGEGGKVKEIGGESPFQEGGVSNARMRGDVLQLRPVLNVADADIINESGGLLSAACQS